MRPQLTSFTDVLTKADEISAYVAKNPSSDIVYYIKVNESDSAYSDPAHPNPSSKSFVGFGILDTYIAGSKAVTLLHKELKHADAQLVQSKSLFNTDHAKNFIKS